MDFSLTLTHTRTYTQIIVSEGIILLLLTEVAEALVLEFVFSAFEVCTRALSGSSRKSFALELSCVSVWVWI